MTLKARLTEAIDTANAMLAQNLAMPGRIEAVALLADSRLAEVYVRFENGGMFAWITSAATLCPLTLINVAHCSHLIDVLEIETDPDNPDLTAHASGYQPQAATDDGRTVTHAAPEVVQ